MTRRSAALGAVLALATMVLAPDVSPAGAAAGRPAAHALTATSRGRHSSTFSAATAAVTG